MVLLVYFHQNMPIAAAMITMKIKTHVNTDFLPLFSMAYFPYELVFRSFAIVPPTPLDNPYNFGTTQFDISVVPLHRGHCQARRLQQ